MKLHSRKTDILTLQEDRISYVLASKSALFDAAGNSTLTSIPEVLGVQIARVEEFGISYNPESFSAWGTSVYFSDTKRGSILRLTGGAIKTDQLEVISSYGMRSYFRDEFASKITTQKLGGYDPYMDEYVINSNSISIPRPLETVECGTMISQTDKEGAFEVVYILPSRTGEVKINYEILNVTSDISIEAVWDGTSYTRSNATSTGVFKFDKNKLYPTQIKLTVTSNTKSTYNIGLNCPTRVTGSVTQVVLASNQDSGKQTHVEYQWSDQNFTSPWQTSLAVVSPVNTGGATFLNYVSGTQSVGMIPHGSPGLKIRARVKPQQGDDLAFTPTSKMYIFQRSDSQGGGISTLADWDLTVMSGLSKVVPVYSSGSGASESFEVEKTISGNVFDFAPNLFVVWDFRPTTDNHMCFDATDQAAVCGCPVQSTTFYLTQPAVSTASQACALDTSNSGNNLPSGFTLFQTSFTGNGGSTPSVGDIVYADTSATPQDLMGPGFYKLTPTLSFPNGRIIEVAQGSNSITGICITKIIC